MNNVYEALTLINAQIYMHKNLSHGPHLALNTKTFQVSVPPVAGAEITTYSNKAIFY